MHVIFRRTDTINDFCTFKFDNYDTVYSDDKNASFRIYK